ncbi:MAG: glycosyltransferase family 2 protein [Bacteroidales bacterium]
MKNNATWVTGVYPLVSMVIINFEGINHTFELINSLKEVDYPNFEILVVDNGSQPSEADLISKKYPEICVIRSNNNLGYAGGCNLGAKYCSGKYYFFLNNDLIVDKNFLRPCVEMAEKKKYVGAINPKILYYDNPDVIQYAGYTSFSRILIRNKSIGYNCSDGSGFGEDREIPTFIGTAMMIPSWTFDHVGHVNEDYFLYYEEHEWSSRMKKKGYRFYLVGDSKIYHKGSATTGKNSPQKEYYLLKNRIRFARLCETNFFLFSFLYLSFGVGAKKYIEFRRNKKYQHAKMILKAIYDSRIYFKS